MMFFSGVMLPIFIGFVLYKQQPQRMSLMFTEWYGWVVLAVVAVMMAIAAWMIRKIVNIDVAPGFTAAVAVLPGSIGALSGVVFPKSLVRPDRNNIAPRVGIAA